MDALLLSAPAFVAPEVLVPNCRYDERIDMWSVGCLLYMLLGGYPPFQDKNHKGLFRKIRGADFCFHEAHWKNVSISAKQLIASLLVVDPRHRVSARVALDKSPWFKMSEHALRQHDLSASLGEIKMFNARRQLKGAIRAVMWTVRWKLKSSSDLQRSNSFMASRNDFLATNKSDNTMLGKETDASRFLDLYELGVKIETCQSGVSWECTHKYKREVYAVKVIERREERKKTVNGRSLTEAVLHEAAILDSLNHKHVVKFIDFFEEDDYFYLVTERMYGGDLFDRIIHKKHYSEKDARGLARVLIEAVNYLHSQRVAHRDLKPQNLLLKTDNDDPDIKIADFGFACRVHTPQSLITRCGSKSLCVDCR
jgi:serine/threonine protein kinase